MRYVLCLIGCLLPSLGIAAEPITIEVDATDAPRQIYHARLSIPAKPGPLTLHYPKWLPGSHGPTGPIRDLASLKLQANGKPLDWKRDELDLYSITCDVPEDCKSVEVSLDLLVAGNSGPTRGTGVTATPRIAFIKWYHLLLYPKYDKPLQLPYQASLKLPAGWKLGTALPVASTKKDRTTFETVTLETLIDSPVLCGEHFREIPVGPKNAVKHWLILAGDSEASLDIKPSIKKGYDQLVSETLGLFGAHHFRSYRFLVALSEHLPYDGLEHHESGFMFLPERAMIDDDTHKRYGFLPPHEYIHSWVGKYRRPASIITTDYQQPQKTRLLWVYEGLTTYLHMVLSARSGLWNAEDVRDELALLIERFANQPGRA